MKICSLKKKKIFIAGEQLSHSRLLFIIYSLTFFTNHGSVSAELITITKIILLNELLGMTMHREVNVRQTLMYISVGKKTPIFEYFSGKLC